MQKKSEHLHMRADPEVKALAAEYAESKGKTLSELVHEYLERCAKKVQ